MPGIITENKGNKNQVCTFGLENKFKQGDNCEYDKFKFIIGEDPKDPRTSEYQDHNKHTCDTSRR